MKLITLLLVTILGISSCSSKNETSTNSIKQLRHVVLFKFKETATATDVKKVETAFVNLPNEISEIVDFEWGLNNSSENLNKGFTHCFFITFASEKDRAIYLPHASHKAFVAMLDPYLEDVLVLDYWSK